MPWGVAAPDLGLAGPDEERSDLCVLTRRGGDQGRHAKDSLYLLHGLIFMAPTSSSHPR